MDSKETLFLQSLQELKDLAFEQGNMVTEEQLAAFEQDVELSAIQKELIQDYLKTNKIGIGSVLDDEERMDQADFDYLTTYMEELEGLDIATDGEKRAVSMSAIAADRDAKHRLIEIFLPQVVEVAKLYTGQGVDLADLIGEGNVALALGVDMLGCLESPDEVDGMLGKMIMDAMERLITEEVGEKKTDDKVLRLTNKVAEASVSLAADLGRKVTIEELAREMNLKEEDIKKAVRISAKHMEYIEVPENVDNE